MRTPKGLTAAARLYCSSWCNKGV